MLKRDHRGLIAAVNRSYRCASGAGDGDGLALEVNVLRVGTGSYQHGISVLRGGNGLLDRRLIHGNVDGYLSPGWGDQEKLCNSGRDPRGGREDPWHGLSPYK